MVAVVSGLIGVGHASAGATMSVREVPLRAGAAPRPSARNSGERSVSSITPSGRFDFLGLHWKGAGTVSYRVRRASGTWSGWSLADRDFGPDAGSGEASRSRGWILGEGVWVGSATRIEIRVRGPIHRVLAYTVRSPVSRVPTRSTASVDEPPVITRAGWQADEGLRRAEPVTAPELNFAVVHHTAGTNDYKPEDVPAILRAIQVYHVKGNGWNDIGYNALVDRFGVVYEGRFGGLDQNIVGAHAIGFNTGSFGIAVLGEFTHTPPPPAAREALARMLAWRLDLAHVDPLATFDVISGGSERFPPGVPVFLRAISGHRDTGLTACPGQKLYDLLPAIANRTAAIGLPKLYEPELTGTVGGPLTFTARLSAALPWTFTVTASTGATAFEASGEGTTVNVAWDTSGLAQDSYRWHLDAPGVTPAEGTLDAGASAGTLAITGGAADPETFSPDGDGTLDTTTLSYTLSTGASVGVTVYDAAGVELSVVESPRWRAPGAHVITFDGLGLPDGVYDVRLMATATGGRTASSSIRVAISRTLRGVRLVHPVLSPNGDGRNDTLAVKFALAGPAVVSLKILRGSRWTATPFSGQLDAGPQLLEWDGSKRVGALREGAYVAVLEATDSIGVTRVVMPFVADWTPPRLVLLSLNPLLLRVNEPATLRIRADGLNRRIRVQKAGLVRVAAVRRPRKLVVVATDQVGNTSAPLRRLSP
jgi:N-acetylmuramoyl-L-alanine amidase